LKWIALDSLGIGSDPVVANGLLYITCDDNYLYAVDANTGAVTWKFEIYANGASAAVAGGILYCGGGGNRSFYALNAETGNITWIISMPDNEPFRTSTPIVVGRTSL
jgi:eukaryotic-like serine/threonine-protein kinase